MSKTVLFQIIQFCILFSSICPIDRNLSGATTPGQSGPGSDGNEGVLHILQSSSIIEASPSDCLVSYPGHSFGGSSPSAKFQLLYSLASCNWAILVLDRYTLYNITTGKLFFRIGNLNYNNLLRIILFI